MPATQPRSFKLSDEDMARLDVIAQAWADRNPTGRKLTRTDVIRAMIRDSIIRLDRTTKKSKESPR